MTIVRYESDVRIIHSVATACTVIQLFFLGLVCFVTASFAEAVKLLAYCPMAIYYKYKNQVTHAVRILVVDQ